MAHFKAKDLYRRITEECRSKGRPVGSGMGTETLREFSEKGLALDDEQQRIPGKSPQVRLEDFSLREMAANLIINRSDGQPVGDTFIQTMMNPDVRMREATSIDAVDYSMFMGITGQLLVNNILQGFMAEEFIFTGLAGTYKSPFPSGERVPGVSPPKDPDYDGTEDTTLVSDGQPFKYFGFGERYIELPDTQLHGGIIGIGKLAIWADRTGLIAQQATQVGNILGLRKEKRGLKCLIGADSATFKEKRLSQSAITTIDPYQYVSGSGSQQFADGLSTQATEVKYVNDFASDPLVDYTDIRDADIQFAKTVDPDTGEPVVVGKPFLFASKPQELEVQRILQAYNIWKVSQAGMDTVNSLNTISPNPLGGVTTAYSRQLRAQLVKAGVADSDADKPWWYGDIAAAIKYIENWPLKVIAAPPNSEAEFMQDIVVRYRADERGRWAWFNPRLLQRHNYVVIA